MSVFDLPAIVRAERDGVATDNHLGLVETMLVTEDVHGKAVEVDLNHDGVDVRIGHELASLDADTALRVAAAILAAAAEAKERQ